MDYPYAVLCINASQEDHARLRRLQSELGCDESTVFMRALALLDVTVGEDQVVTLPPTSTVYPSSMYQVRHNV